MLVARELQLANQLGHDAYDKLARSRKGLTTAGQWYYGFGRHVPPPVGDSKAPQIVPAELISDPAINRPETPRGHRKTPRAARAEHEGRQGMAKLPAGVRLKRVDNGYAILRAEKRIGLVYRGVSKLGGTCWYAHDPDDRERPAVSDPTRTGAVADWVARTVRTKPDATAG